MGSVASVLFGRWRVGQHAPAFSKEKLNVFPYQLRAAWDRLVFSGTGQAPNTVSSSEEMLAKVASTPGAIGYLTKSRMDSSVDVLQIK